MFIAIVCTVIMGISRQAGNLIMGLLSLLLRTALSHQNGNIHPSHVNTLAQIPSTIATALLKFNLDGHVITYAVCPTCHCTYEPQSKLGCTIPIYPEQCTNKIRPESDICNEGLLHLRSSDDQGMVPLKPFAYHSFPDYLAGLFSRKGIEEMIDQSCDKAMAYMKETRQEFVQNIFEAEFVRTFEGPDSTSEKKTLFIDRPDGVGRCLFSLNVDFFHPEGMRIRGASASCGIISLACLNLHLDIRYKPENMYISIINGPREPHLTDLNHYIRPLIDDMVSAWYRGLRLSQTALYPAGRLTNSAIAIVICDLPAARKTAQLASHSSHYYCSVCQCWHKSTVGRTDYDNWKQRDTSDMRRHAIQWRDAPTSKEQDRIFNTHGLRWSELWRLPYWDPTRQLVVDSMHCILEVLVQCHCRDVLGLTAASAREKMPVQPAFSYDFSVAEPGLTTLTQKEIKQVTQIQTLLVAPIDIDENQDIAMEHLSSKLLQKNSSALKFVCNDLDCLPVLSRVRKANYATALVNWVSLGSSAAPETDTLA
jgi:hypothetical protein